MASFGTRLKQLRKKYKLTQPVFAEKINAGKSTVAMWETGDRHPDYDTMKKIADFFDVSVDYLLCYTDHPKGVIDKELEEFYTMWEGLSEEEKQHLYDLAKTFNKLKKRNNES